MAAVGASGAAVVEEKISVWLSGKNAVKNGSAGAARREELQEVFKAKDIQIKIHLGLGKGKARVWTCDFSYAYIDINV